jgi:hypothetical protein
MARPPKTTRLKALATYKLLAARARVVLGTTKVQSGTINALARMAVMAATGRGATFSASVKASLLITGAKAGKFFTLISAADTVTASEIRNFNMSKLRVDEVQAVDRAFAEISKVFVDAAYVADQVDRLVGKGIGDIAATSELLVRDSTKPLADVALITDLAAKGFFTARQDAFTVGDNNAVEFGKNAREFAITHDLLTRTVAFVRFFTDSADATDEINADLLTDDGQVVFLSKVVRDTATTASQAVFALSNVQADAAVISDEVLLAAAKRLDDIVGMGDFSGIDLDTARYDAAISSDVAALSTGKQAQDTVSSSSSTVRSFFKSLHDEVTATDALNFFLAAYRATGVVTSEDVLVVRIAAGGVPAQTEDKYAVDFAALGVQKNFADAVGVTDDFFGEATIDDEQVTFIGKNLLETLPTTDLRTLTLRRTLQESTNAGSSGLLAMTDYCDSTYFSQAYVGTERNFS